MAIEEQAEQMIMNGVIQIIENGARLTCRTGACVAGKAVKAGFHVVGKGTSMLTGAVKDRLDTGAVSERKLQASGQDIHVQELDIESLKEVAKSLRKAGITYHVEASPEGRTFYRSRHARSQTGIRPGRNHAGHHPGGRADNRSARLPTADGEAEDDGNGDP